MNLVQLTARNMMQDQQNGGEHPVVGPVWVNAHDVIVVEPFYRLDRHRITDEPMAIPEGSVVSIAVGVQGRSFRVDEDPQDVVALLEAATTDYLEADVLSDSYPPTLANDIAHDEGCDRDHHPDAFCNPEEKEDV